MTAGIGSYQGMAVPLMGEAEITQVTAATDILTITGVSGQTGDFLVLRDSDETELLAITSAGAFTVSGEFTNTLSASSATSAYKVSVTATGALASGATGPVGFLVSQSSKSVLTAAFGFTSGAGSEVGSCTYLLMADGSKAPTYFLGISASVGPGIGAAVANGFFDDSLKLNTFTCDHPFGGLKIIAGSVAYYLLAAQATGIT